MVHLCYAVLSHDSELGPMVFRYRGPSVGGSAPLNLTARPRQIFMKHRQSLQAPAFGPWESAHASESLNLLYI